MSTQRHVNTKASKRQCTSETINIIAVLCGARHSHGSSSSSSSSRVLMWMRPQRHQPRPRHASFLLPFHPSFCPSCIPLFLHPSFLPSFLQPIDRNGSRAPPDQTHAANFLLETRRIRTRGMKEDTTPLPSSPSPF